MDAINGADTTWVLVSSALVMLMTPGLAFFYGGLVRQKNVLSTLMHSFFILALISVQWVLWGYSLAFGPSVGGFIGGLNWVGLNGVGIEPNPDYAATIPHLAFMVFQMMFAIITPALITGAIAERVNFKAWLLIMVLWSLVVYVPVAHWVWGPGGWIAADGGIDFAGGLVVHIASGCSGLVAALMFGKRYKTGHSIPNDVPMIMLGTALLWFGWFGFNAGSAIASGTLAAHAFMTTFVGGATAFVAWMLTEWVRSGKPTAVGSATGIVAGLVCITPAAGYVDITAAIIMTAIAGVVCNMIAYQMKKQSRLDDALDVFACHGVGGIIGAVFTGVFASKAVNGALAVEGLAISGETKLFVSNIVAVGAVCAYAVILTYLVIKLVNLVMPIKVSDETQSQGLDTSLHGEFAKFNERQPGHTIDQTKGM
ncbi:MAG: ammonium transporter [Alphaproteobacteria bacterium]|nr:ammonium transporter [Alphaproteobacteria bacterium]